MMETRRPLLLTLIGLAVLVFTAAPTWAAEDTTGKVSIESTSVGAGIGVTWGDGVLEYRGQTYAFTVTGFSIGDVGASKVVARGEVYNLKKVEDFAGMFMAAMASATFGGGAGAAAMQNQNQVNMVWTAANQGVSFSLANAGLNVRLTEAAQQQAAKSRRDASETQPAATPRTSR